MYPKYFFENGDPRLKDNLSELFLFLDFDGTLVPIKDDPAQCFLKSDTMSQMEAISQSGKATVAVLSGRTVEEIKKRVPVQGIYYGGNHGLEISGPDLSYLHPDALFGKQAMEQIFKKIKKKMLNIGGALVERKKFGFSLHYRMANKEDRVLIKKIFYETISSNQYRYTFSILPGKKVLELVPKVKWDKGRAALFLLKRQKKDYLPIYVGDDKTDETGFNALRTQGVTVRVGKSKKTKAEYYLKGQWQMIKFLQHIHSLVKLGNRYA